MLAAGHHLPVMYATREYAEDGGLISYGPNFVEMTRRSAVLADKILKGAKPTDLPIEQPTKFELIILNPRVGLIRLLNKWLIL